MIRRAKTTDLLHSHSLNILLKAVNDGDELSIPSAKKLNLTFCSTENEAWEISKIFYDIKEVTYIGIRRNGYSLVQRANLIEVPVRIVYLPSGLLRRLEVKGNWFQILNYNGVQYLGSKNSVNSLQRPHSIPEVGSPEVDFREVGFREVTFYFRVVLPPLVPGLNALFKFG